MISRPYNCHLRVALPAAFSVYFRTQGPDVHFDVFVPLPTAVVGGRIKVTSLPWANISAPAVLTGGNYFLSRDLSVSSPPPALQVPTLLGGMANPVTIRLRGGLQHNERHVLRGKASARC